MHRVKTEKIRTNRNQRHQDAQTLGAKAPQLPCHQELLGDLSDSSDSKDFDSTFDRHPTIGDPVTINLIGKGDKF